MALQLLHFRVGVSYYDSSIRQLHVMEVWEDGSMDFPLIDIGMRFMFFFWKPIFSTPIGLVLLPDTQNWLVFFLVKLCTVCNQKSNYLFSSSRLIPYVLVQYCSESKS